MLIKWLGYLSEALYKPSIMSHKAKEGPNLSISLWRCIFGDGLHIDDAGLNTFLQYLVSKIISPLRRDYTSMVLVFGCIL